MILRPYASGDPVAAHIASIYREHQLCFDSEFEDDLLDISKAYASGVFYVAEENGELLGTGAAVADGGARLIRRMYVSSKARRQGLAHKLLQACLGFGSFSRTHLWSDVRFREAHQLYLKAGFKMGHTRVLTDPDRSVERYFWKET
jgi:GNAT superfamily N-acetyltransferase